MLNKMPNQYHQTQIIKFIVLLIICTPFQTFSKSKNKYNYIRRFKNNSLKIKASTKKNQFHGKYVEYYENGQIKAIGRYQQGTLEGLWKRFHPNGNLLDQGYWLKNQPDGLWKVYNSEKKLIQSGYFSCGKKSGFWKANHSWNHYFGGNCLWTNLLDFRLNLNYNHHSSEQYLVTTGAGWNPTVYSWSKVKIAFGFGWEFIREMKEKKRYGHAGANRDYASFYSELQISHHLRFDNIYVMEYFFGSQDFDVSNLGGGDIYGARLHLPPYFLSKYSKSLFIGAKIFSHRVFNFNQISIGLTL